MITAGKSLKLMESFEYFITGGENLMFD